MNTNDPREPASTEGGQFGDDDNVEVLVEDLFIEDYQTPLAPQRQLAPRERGRIARIVKNATPLVMGIAAVGGFVLAMLLLGSHHRKPSRMLRSFLELGRER